MDVTTWPDERQRAAAREIASRHPISEIEALRHLRTAEDFCKRLGLQGREMEQAALDLLRTSLHLSQAMNVSPDEVIERVRRRHG